jgi:hypothetical protein
MAQSDKTGEMIVQLAIKAHREGTRPRPSRASARKRDSRSAVRTFRNAETRPA